MSNNIQFTVYGHVDDWGNPDGFDLGVTIEGVKFTSVESFETEEQAEEEMSNLKRNLGIE